MASETQPRRKRDELGPNPFRLGPRAQCKAAHQEPALAPQSSSLSSTPTAAPQAVDSIFPQVLPPAIQPATIQEDHDLNHGSLSSRSPHEATLGIPVASPRFFALPPWYPSLPPAAAPQAIPAPIPQALPQPRRPRRIKKPPGPSLLRLSSRLQDKDCTESPAWFLPYPDPSSVPTTVLEGLLRSDFSIKPLVHKAFALHPCLQRELQREKDRRLQAWLSSWFGRLPSEIRVMIYEHVLIVPPSQSPITIRGPSEEKKADSDKASTKPPSSTSHMSALALLQTCRLIHREAQDIYYARNAFHATSAKQLRRFLLGIGLARCEVLTTLHIEGLLTREPMFEKDWLDQQRRETDMSDAEYQRLSNPITWRLGPDAQAASRLLRECKRLRKVHLLMGHPKKSDYVEIKYIDFVRSLAGERTGNQVDFIDGSRWVVRASPDAWKWYSALIETYYTGEGRTVHFPPLAEGEQRCVEVDIAREQVDGLQSEFSSMKL
ncbi:hypothetical protein ABVK25_002798 [Lepraria finkii]|uniref:DUF7730 domain-containing protein n=1 Tax=Lepraria finkii TaxID=1340010 RepID=A0ABR4BGV1_9LECA